MQRHEFLNWLIEEHGFRSYLEIGCDTDRTFSRIKAAQKTGVDPKRGGTLRITSDKFFFGLASQPHPTRWDLVFVDGLHHRRQALRDTLHALDHLNPGGLVVLDDCWPKKESHQIVIDAEGNPITSPPGGKSWTGDVWKAIVDLRQRPEIDTCTFGDGWGFGVVRLRDNTDLIPTLQAGEELTWKFFQTHHPLLLRLLSFAELKKFLKQN